MELTITLKTCLYAVRTTSPEIVYTQRIKKGIKFNILERLGIYLVSIDLYENLRSILTLCFQVEKIGMVQALT